MAALVAVETVVILVLVVLVAGLLRSHADILRALEELGAGPPTTTRRPRHRPRPRRRHRPTPTGNGYWLADHVGGVFTFGDARHFGSLPARGGTESQVVSISATPDGDGYWMVTETGGVARFGDARHFGER